MNRAEKSENVEVLAARFGRAPIAIFADYRGLTVGEISDLRRQVRKVDGEFVVAKNTLTRLAVKGGDYEAAGQFLSGPTAVAFGYEDVAAVAKAVHGFASDHESLEIKGAVMDGVALEVAQVTQLANMPSRDELRAQFLVLLTTPATQLVRLLGTPAGQLVQVLDAWRRKREEAGESAEAPQAEAAVEAPAPQKEETPEEDDGGAHN